MQVNLARRHRPNSAVKPRQSNYCPLRPTELIIVYVGLLRTSLFQHNIFAVVGILPGRHLSRENAVGIPPVQHSGPEPL